MKQEHQRLVEHIDVEAGRVEISDGYILRWSGGKKRWVLGDLPSEQADQDQALDDHITARNPHESMQFRGTWADGTQYYEHDLAVDDGYAGVALVDTLEKLAPVGQGPIIFGYDGANPVTAVSAKQVIQGMQYTPAAHIMFHGYRVYTISGSNYAIYSLDSDGTISLVVAFLADTTGWQEFSVTPAIWGAGLTFSIFAITTEPDPTPTIWSGDWDYILPNNEGTPAPGTILHATRLPSSFRISKTDNNTNPRGTELEALNPGDIIDGAGMRWSIQAITDNATWMEFSVAPSQQGAPAGVQTFDFETVTPTPIDYLYDNNYWLGDLEVRGLLGVDIPIEDIVPDNNQYGIDVKIQDISYSTDWYLLPSGGGGGGGAGPPGPPGPSAVSVEVGNVAVISSVDDLIYVPPSAGGGDSNVDGGWSDSIYLPSQIFDGGDSTP